MQRVFIPYWFWEEYYAGMWSNIFGEQRDRLLYDAIVFTGNAELYGKYMQRVIREWPYSCLHNLSCVGMNRQAWIGHAACALAMNVPEDIVRLAWHSLTQKQQDEANQQADNAIIKWEEQYKDGIQLCLKLNLE